MLSMGDFRRLAKAVWPPIEKNPAELAAEPVAVIYRIEIIDALDYSSRDASFQSMEVRLPPDQEARLAALAARDGRDVNELAQEAIARLLDDDARFAEAVKRGIAAADRGDFVPSEEVWASVERILQS
jgi:predicted transcriptional regulator